MTVAFDLDALDSMEVDSEVVDPVEQQQEEWFQKRRGRFTCSRFGDLMTRGRGKDEDFGQTALSYIRQVVAERMGSWVFPAKASALEWGTENESLAIAEYQKRFGVEVSHEPFRFFEYESYAGGTPDALVCENGGIEIKCPYDPGQHIATWERREVPRQYIWQVHGHMLVADLDWVDFISFDPRIETTANMVVVRVERDDELIDQLKLRLIESDSLARAMIERLEKDAEDLKQARKAAVERLAGK